MATAALLPQARAVFYDANANPLAGGKVYTYIPSTTTPKTTWQDSAEATPNSNPITLDAYGSCLLYGAGAYQLTVTDALGVSIPAYSGVSTAPSEFMNNLLNQTTAAAALALLLNGVTGITYTISTGTNTTYTPSSGNKYYARSNSGTLMVDTLQGSFISAMPAGTLLYIQNIDTTAMLVLTVGTGSSIIGSVNTFVYLGPGQSIGIFSDGTNYHLIGEPQRARAGAITNFYVTTSGSDSNHGLSASSPFLTIRHAIDVLYQNFDYNSYAPVVNVADGTYAAGVNGFIYVNGLPTGAGYFTVQGNTASPANVVLNATGSAVCNVGGGAQVFFKGFKIASSGSISPSAVAGVGIAVYGAGEVNFGYINFGVCDVAHITSTGSGSANSVAQPYTISGAAVDHIAASQLGLVLTNGSTVTLTGTPAFSLYCVIDSCSVYYATGMTFVGGATGYRYGVSNNSVILTGGGGANYFPGTLAGSATTGGQYS
jgi:hypothetical protein